MAKRKAKQAAKPRARKRGSAAKAPSARAIEAALAGIAHDIRTPLTGIVALAELLASSDVGTREREWANAIKSGADHLAALTTLIVDAVKADAAGLTLRHEPFSPRRLAEAVAVALTARAGNKGIKTEIAIAADLPAWWRAMSCVCAPRWKISPTMRSNSPATGTVVFTAGVRAGRRQARASYFHRVPTPASASSARHQESVPAVRAGQRRDRAPIWRRRPRAGVRQAHRQGHGRRSRRDQQARARHKFPFHGRGRSRRRAAAMPSDTARAARPARALSILCAEDNPYGRVVMNTILTELGHRVDFVESGEAAVQGGGSAAAMTRC